MTFFKRLIRSGLTRNDEYQNKRGIILSNYISIILGVTLLLLFLNRLLFFKDLFLGTFATGFLLFITPILCNRLHFTTLSRLLLCIVPVCFVWYVFITRMWEMASIDQSVYDGLRIFLLSLCFIPYLLFDRSKLPILMVGILPTLLSFLCFGYILQWAGLPQAPSGLTSDDFQLMPVRAFLAYAVISISCFVFQSIISRNDTYNKKLLTELSNRAEEIEMQNEMLVQSQSRLHEINQHLEKLVDEKTRSIKRQNEILLNYSFTNAHKVRGPWPVSLA